MIWLTREQIAVVFGRDYKTISKHINNALREELADSVVVAKFANTTQHGAIKGKRQTHMIDYFNLEVITSVGYREKSKRGVQFRQWANRVLKEYLVKGYAVNERLRHEQIGELRQLVDVLVDGINFTADSAYGVGERKQTTLGPRFVKLINEHLASIAKTSLNAGNPTPHTDDDTPMPYMYRQKQLFANAYARWTEEHDQLLLNLYREGKTIEELTELMQRNKGSIRSRIKKLTSE